MTELPAKQVYAFLNEFQTQQEFTEFVRSQLKICTREMNDILADYSGSREQKFQAICLWKRKVGRPATMERLHQLKNEYRIEKEETYQEEPQQDANSEPSSSAATPHPSTSGAAVNAGAVQSGEPEPSSSAATPHPSASGAAANSGAVQSGEPQPANTHQATPLTRGFGGAASPDDVRAPKPSCNVSASTGSTGVPHQQLGAMNISEDAFACNEITSGLTVEQCSLQDISNIQLIDNKYPVANNPKGYVLIFNNNFKGADGERNGAERDVQNMEKLWKDLGCTVKIQRDKTAEEMLEALEKIAKNQRIGNYDFLVIFVMSHGDVIEKKEVIIAADKKPVPVGRVLLQFNNENCKVLIGKPKLFFFQFCRGHIIDPGMSWGDQEQKLDNLYKSMHDHYLSRCVLDESDAIVPMRSDLLISYATQSGFRSFRNSKGSWFINAIANIFAKHAKKEHVAEMMIRVRSAVMEKTGTTNYTQTENGPCKEMSETCDLLTKKLFLMPGFPNDVLFDD